MKKILLATTMLVGTAGLAAAEVTLSGDARMGILDAGPGDAAFSSRARVTFNLSGETDGGLSFGATFRADNANTNQVTVGVPSESCVADVDADPTIDSEEEFIAALADCFIANRQGGAVIGDAGSVFLSGAFGKLSMGDVDGAAQMATGHVDDVGYTGLGDLNESTFLGAGDGVSDPTALYEFSTGAVGFFASVTNPADSDETYAVGVNYATDAFTVGLGYEDAGSVSHVVAKGSATFAGVTFQALYGTADLGDFDGDQYAVSASYSMDAVGLTAYYTDDSELGGREAYGLGASYDLGGGAAVVGGMAKDKTRDANLYDLGVTFTF